MLGETIWSLTSPCLKRFSGSRNFRSLPQKDFCNNICHKRKSPHLIDHFVGDRQCVRRNGEAQRLSRLHVDDQLEFVRRLNRQVARR